MRDPIRFQLLLATFAVWMNREQTNVIDYLCEENRVLKEQLGKRCCASMGAASAEGHLLLRRRKPLLW